VQEVTASAATSTSESDTLEELRVEELRAKRGLADALAACVDSSVSERLMADFDSVVKDESGDGEGGGGGGDAALGRAKALWLAKGMESMKLSVELEHERASNLRNIKRVNVLEAQGRRVNAGFVCWSRPPICSSHVFVRACFVRPGNCVLRAELDKVTDYKDKLSELCRALQAEVKATKEHAKRVKDEAAVAVDSEIARRRELTDQFSGTIESVQARLEEQATTRKEQLTENEDLRKKLLSLLSRFEEQQAVFDQQLKYAVIHTL
jgi:hypothetical protein